MCKLTVELIPKSSFYVNLRSVLSVDDWDLLRRDTYQKAGYLCDVCGSQGKKWPVECHEIWKYTENNYQILSGLIALCPSCHEVKHIGLAGVRGRTHIAKAHLMNVNNWSNKQADKHINEAWRLWGIRSKQTWVLEQTWVYNKLKELRND